MKFLNKIKDEARIQGALQYREKLLKDKVKYDKRLYDSDIVQDLLSRVARLEDQIKKMQDNENLK